MRILSAKVALTLLTTGVLVAYASPERMSQLWSLGTVADADSRESPAGVPINEPVETPPQFGVADELGHWESFEKMHSHYTQAFVNSEGFGISRVMTFDEPSQRRLRIDDLAYRVESLHLLGLMSEMPKVYQSDWMGLVRERLATYPTRKLTTFESNSLPRLHQGESITWEIRRSEETATLVGALRAGESCRECHAAADGELLGAFIYNLKVARLPSGLEGLNVPGSPSS